MGLCRSPDFFIELFKRFYESYEKSGKTQWLSISGGYFPLDLSKDKKDVDAKGENDG